MCCGVPIVPRWACISERGVYLREGGGVRSLTTRPKWAGVSKIVVCFREKEGGASFSDAPKVGRCFLKWCLFQGGRGQCLLLGHTQSGLVILNLVFFREEGGVPFLGTRPTQACTSEICVYFREEGDVAFCCDVPKVGLGF